MSLKLTGERTDSVFAAVWAATAIKARCEGSKIRDGYKARLEDFAFVQQRIVDLAQRLCSASVAPARVAQWATAGKGNHNYLVAVGRMRRLVLPGEFNGDDEVPSWRVDFSWPILRDDADGNTETFRTFVDGWWRRRYPTYFEADTVERLTGTRPPEPRVTDKVGDEDSPVANDMQYHCRILGLQAPFTSEELTRRYRESAMKYHPDKVSGLGEKLIAVAEAEMKKINESYQYLKPRVEG